MDRRRALAFTIAVFILLVIFGWSFYSGKITGKVVDFIDYNRIDIELNSFNLPLIQVNVGESVLWANVDTEEHTVTSEDFELNSALISQGEMYSHVFNEPGIYSYYCKLHPTVTGQIIVN